MASLRIQFSELGFLHFSRTQFNLSMRKQKTSCSLRNGARKPMWRSRVLSTESIQAVQSLKLAKSPEKMEEVLKMKLSRLLKADVLDTLTELQRQNEVHLALQVFNFVRNEEWYVPDLSVFNSMIMMLGKNKLIGMAEQLFVDLMKEGLQPDSRTYTEFIGAYFRVDLVEKAMEMYELMKKSGFLPDKLTMSILIRSLQKAEEKELVARVKKECADYIDYPEKFLKEIESTNSKRRSLDLV
ncbi:PREDICTED: pentatricopeptide repeat-containing protein At3g46870-like [Nicotiana attenuata]|uniref:Pentatricopeptide repeat-containing protein n=1 Tax=Nicotiana attenuata TaxID=49451 RepID=A0A1J6IHH5_NICAT|nr:PREDICTED: pentatricopeptide repeat-containing protein At3g46870-like [Nicotiana attenuata]OIS98354.1 pentatricopeptide repeat-containing protein [Nicotiana attenuata]